MLIRSQNKTGLVNLDQIDTIAAEECENHVNILSYRGTPNTAVLLARYSTKEKAIKVLDMIQNDYQYVNECKYLGIGASQPEFVFPDATR